MPLSNLTPEQIANTVTPAQIPYFDAQEFATLYIEQLQAFTADLLAAMTEEQTAAYDSALTTAAPSPVVETPPTVEPEPTVESIPTVVEPVPIVEATVESVPTVGPNPVVEVTVDVTP